MGETKAVRNKYALLSVSSRSAGPSCHRVGLFGEELAVHHEPGRFAVQEESDVLHQHGHDGLAVVSPVILYTNWQVIDKNPDLIAFPMSRELPENVLSLVYRKDDPMPQYAKDFIRVVREVFTVYGRLLELEAQSRGSKD